MSTSQKITKSALMLALSTVLMLISKTIPSPWLQGGSVTLASMVPIIIIGIMFGTKWGLCSSLGYSFIQLLLGFYPPPTRTFFYFVLVVFIDYILAFGVLGLSGLFYSISGKKSFSAPLSGFIVTFLRYVCHVISGILIWGAYAENGQTVLAYSITYNATYMIPEIIITTVVLAIISKMQFFNKKY